MHKFARILIIQQVPPAINKVIDRFIKPKLNELAIKDMPQIDIIIANKRWYGIMCVRYFISDPPNMYPMALAKKMKE